MRVPSQGSNPETYGTISVESMIFWIAADLCAALVALFLSIAACKTIEATSEPIDCGGPKKDFVNELQ